MSVVSTPHYDTDGYLKVNVVASDPNAGGATVSVIDTPHYDANGYLKVNVVAGGAAAPLTLSSGTLTTSSPALTATQTWNSSGVTFTGIKLNVTSTASAAASLLLDLQVAGSSVFNVTKTGGLVALGASIIGGSAGTALDGTSAAGASLYVRNSTTLWSGAAFGWSSTSDPTAAQDTIVRRAAAAVVQFGTDLNGTAIAQTLQACNGITGTDKAGADFTLQSGKGTGDGTISSLLFKTPALAGSGTTVQTLTTRLTIDSSGIKATGYKSSDGSAGVSVGPYTTITSITVKNGLITALTGA